MTSAELDRLWQRAGRKIVSAEITSGSGPLTDGVYDQARRVIATFDDFSQLELFSSAHTSGPLRRRTSLV
jgi:hypothetical protein